MTYYNKPSQYTRIWVLHSVLDICFYFSFFLVLLYNIYLICLLYSVNMGVPTDYGLSFGYQAWKTFHVMTYIRNYKINVKKSQYNGTGISWRLKSSRRVWRSVGKVFLTVKKWNWSIAPSVAEKCFSGTPPVVASGKPFFAALKRIDKINPSIRKCEFSKHGQNQPQTKRDATFLDILSFSEKLALGNARCDFPQRYKEFENLLATGFICQEIIKFVIIYSYRWISCMYEKIITEIHVNTIVNTNAHSEVFTNYHHILC